MARPKRSFKSITLSSAPFYASLVVITSLATFIGIFWGFNEYQAYQESLVNIRNTYKRQYEARVKEELMKVVELIDYKRRQNDLMVEQDLRERVQAAYTIASHNFRLYKGEQDRDGLRAMIIELLRPIRWDNGRGYYFIGRVNKGIIDLFADEPFFEGKSASDFTRITGQDVINEIILNIKDKEAGVFRYDLTKPNYSGQSYPKIAFVKYFAPLDWFIGAGIYTEELEQTMQQEVLARIRDIQFGKGGDVFCFRSDGTILSNQDERLIGRSVKDLRDASGNNYGAAFWETAMGEEKEGFIHYSFTKPMTKNPQQKLGFIQHYSDWDWVLGTSMFMDAMEQTIATESEHYREISFKNVFTFLVLFAIAVAFLLLSAFFYSLKIKQGIRLFTNFFREAADSNVKIDPEELAFQEFEDMSRLANRMVEDRVANELILLRNELRLDTLLQLGMMDKHSLQDKYDFILRRIVQITNSEEGYLALVNTTQSHITICSYIVFDQKDIKTREGELNLSRSLQHGGLPGKAIMKKSAIIENSILKEHILEQYPYGKKVTRHLDVPIYNDGKIVIVAGVCNKKEQYGNGDIRQMTILLEGMWLHVLKKCAEEERSRLERHIIAVSEEERSRIGRDLHDDLCSHLTGVELLSKVLHQQLENEAPDREEQLAMIRNLIRDAIEKTRRLSQGLYPVHVIEYGLEASIEELIAEVSALFRVEFDLSWEEGEQTLGKNTAMHLYYIIREGVFNAARHGNPNKIGIYMEVLNGVFNLKIVDDGIGFETTPAATGMGFHTMKYRAKAIGAELTINSGKTGGTIILVTGEELE